MKNVYQTTVLGKRKAYSQTDCLVLHLSPAPTSSSSHSESDQPSISQNPPIIINGLLVPGTKKRYRCTFGSCKKAYAKPSRLEEHERTHTGEVTIGCFYRVHDFLKLFIFQRPFICETCGKSYLRDTHLHVHARSHLPETSRPLACERPNCKKRFWTSQHLQVHYSWHDGAKPYRVIFIPLFRCQSRLKSYSAMKEIAIRHLQNITSSEPTCAPNMPLLALNPIAANRIIVPSHSTPINT